MMVTPLMHRSSVVSTIGRVAFTLVCRQDIHHPKVRPKVHRSQLPLQTRNLSHQRLKIPFGNPLLCEQAVELSLSVNDLCTKLDGGGPHLSEDPLGYCQLFLTQLKLLLQVKNVLWTWIAVQLCSKSKAHSLSRNIAGDLLWREGLDLSDLETNIRGLLSSERTSDP